MRRFLSALPLIVLAAPVPVAAADAALVIGNDRYRTFDRVAAASAMDDAAAALEAAGAEVVAARDVDRAGLLDALRRFSQVSAGSDAQAAVLVGRFALFGGEAYFLPLEAAGSSVFDGLELGVPVSTVAQILAETPGPDTLVLGIAGEPKALLPEIDLPRGVTLVAADPDRALAFVEDRMAAPGAPRLDALGPAYTLRGAPDPTPSDPATPATRTPPEPEPQPAPPAAEPDFAAAAERDYWALAQSRDDVPAYRNYLDRYPDGRFAEAATARIAELTDTPASRAERAEAALGLDAEARRGIQRDLSLMGYDTRGIDGIFGSGTRAAIRAWQQAAGEPPTGFLTEDQIAALGALGARRAAEGAGERARRRAADESMWAEIGPRPSARDLAAYLDRFPDGAYADRARRRLAERQADGQGAPVFEPPRAGATEDRQATAEEAALGLTPVTARAVEQRLAAMGFAPGEVDGRFDRRTRAALRRYQDAAGLPVTGYVNEITAVRLLTDTLRGLLQ